MAHLARGPGSPPEKRLKREQLEHLIRAAADIADDDEVIVIGSQAVLAQFPEAPSLLLRSMEADLFPKNHAERWDLIDGTMGEGSPFHETFGYYAQGVEETTAVLPRGWKDRLIAIQNERTRGVIGWCLEIHDLVISKYVAGREKDHEFIGGAVQAALVDEGVLLERLASTDLEDELRAAIQGRIASDYRAIRTDAPPST